VSGRDRRRAAAWLVALWLGAFAVAQAPESGDALGAGLTPPTAARYADPAWYDLLDARWAIDASGATAFELELAAIDPEAPLLQPILEAYLMQTEGLGRTTLLGTGLGMPEDAGWAVAVRVAGTAAWAWTSGPDASASARPLNVEVVGRTVRLAWPSDLPVEGSWVAVSGVYDPFSDTGWRPFADEASPWAFAGPAATPPVVSVVPGDDDALLRLHATGLLPRGVVPRPIGTVSQWWWWMGVGLALVALGLTWRGGRSPSAPPPTPAVVVEAGSRAERDAPAEPERAPVLEPEAAPEPPPIASGLPALIGDDDLVAGADAAGARQSAVEERSRGTATAIPAAEAVDEDADASSSERTTRAPSAASRSAKRS
jgi:hypothetical protein